METSIDRLKFYLKDALKIGQNKFEASCGISRGYISNNQKGSIGSDIMNKISEAYPDLNLWWLVTGKGEMILAKGMKNETRPRVPYLAAAGTLTTALDGIGEEACEQVEVIKAFPHYDFTIVAYGDSMLPEIKSGDELACRRVKDKYELQWGKTYVLDTDDGIVVKNIYDDGEYVLCKSENPKFKDFRKLKSEIYSISLVVGILRRY